MQGDVGNPDDQAATATENGLHTVNGLYTKNGLHTVNGLDITNGLHTVNGLQSASGLMTTALGREQVSYIVRCALPAGATVVKQDQNGVNYTFTGVLGLAPEWADGACGTSCQENVSACLLAHVNTAGIHVPLWIVSQSSAVGWGQDPEFPNQEGSFFGNIFQPGAHGSDPLNSPMYYCMGAKYNVSPPQGRLGSTQTSPPYVNAFGAANLACANRCTNADYPSAADGYKACNGWNAVVTVWRQNSATTKETTSPTGGIGKGFRWK
jgi:hypothetical protein